MMRASDQRFFLFWPQCITAIVTKQAHESETTKKAASRVNTQVNLICRSCFTVPRILKRRQKLITSLPESQRPVDKLKTTLDYRRKKGKMMNTCNSNAGILCPLQMSEQNSLRNRRMLL